MKLRRLAIGGHADLVVVGRQRRWIALILTLAVAARLLRAAIGFPLWSDEAFLSASFLQRGYGDMFRPLEYHQVCPLGFLWGQLTAVRLLGFSEFTLRLLPLTASIGGLLLFVRLAGRTLSGAAQVLAVALFAFSYPGLRYANEAKPYAVDVFVSVALLLLAVEWFRRPKHRGWLWALAAAAPLAIAVSFPAVFVAGGISLAVAIALVRGRSAAADWCAWLALTVSLSASFLASYWLCIRPQSAAELSEQMQPYWSGSFPPRDSLAHLAGWLFSIHTGDMLAHPFGGPKCASLATTIVCLVGLVTLWRERRRDLILLGLAPAALNLAAAALRRYPYGGQVRVALYLMPLICLLAGIGLAAAIGWFARRRPQRATWLWAILLATAAIPVGSAVRDVVQPGRTASDIRARDFARWFWYEQAQQAEVVCLKSDWKLDMVPYAFQYWYSALYWCNQWIYLPQRGRGEPPHLERVTAQWPLRCVLYHTRRHPPEPKALAGWLGSMAGRWKLVDRRPYYVTHEERHGQVIDVSTIEVFEFVPK